jgi:hypothetical protein
LFIIGFSDLWTDDLKPRFDKGILYWGDNKLGDKGQFLSAPMLEGIWFCTNSNEVKNISYFRKNNYMFFSVFDHMKRGNLFSLYVDSLKTNVIVDKEFKRDYLYNKRGVFLLMEENRVALLSLPIYKNNKLITPIHVYKYDKQGFVYIMSYDVDGEIDVNHENIKFIFDEYLSN